MTSTPDLRISRHLATRHSTCELHLLSLSVKVKCYSRFGDNDYEEWSDFLQEYSPPPFTLPSHLPALSFGVAGPGSGVPFHTHG